MGFKHLSNGIYVLLQLEEVNEKFKMLNLLRQQNWGTTQPDESPQSQEEGAQIFQDQNLSEQEDDESRRTLLALPWHVDNHVISDTAQKLNYNFNEFSDEGAMSDTEPDAGSGSVMGDHNTEPFSTSEEICKVEVSKRT